MDLLLAFAVFLAAMLAALIKDFSMIFALLAGLAAFIAVGLKRGFSLKELAHMGIGGAKDSLIVIEVMAIIGFVTAVWRVSGTITIFVYYGIKIITPSLFLLIAFLLACILSYAIGTSFGVAGTVGVIFMTLARSGGVVPILTAGVLMSGVYFGDRGSPASSNANMIAGITGTEIFTNVKLAMKTGLTPFIACCIIYTVMSVMNPIEAIDTQLVNTFETEFNLSLWAFVPAVLMLVLPFFKVSVLKSMGLSIASGILVAWLVQGVPLMEVLKICVMGYEAKSGGLGEILNGGGLMSMLEIVVVLIISCSYSGIFDGTKMLESLQDSLSKACTKAGRFTVMVVLSAASAMVFCNQTIATLMCNDLLAKSYLDTGGTKQELAIDMENSVALIACIVPWCIGCSVPLSFFGVDSRAMLFAFYMYGVPLYYLFRKKKFFPEAAQQ